MERYDTNYFMWPVTTEGSNCNSSSVWPVTTEENNHNCSNVNSSFQDDSISNTESVLAVSASAHAQDSSCVSQALSAFSLPAPAGSVIPIIGADKATQYEATDAMIANFVNSDLIVELNDRDSACTSLSDGFTFSKDYGTPKSLYSSVTDL